MSLLNALKVINNQKDNQVAAARVKVSHYLHARFNKTVYEIPLDDSTKRTYSATDKTQLIADFHKEHAVIIAAEQEGLLDKLDSISTYFEIQCSALLKQYDIAYVPLVEISEEKTQTNSAIPQSPFEIIYTAAKQKNSSAIKEILQEVCIDVEISLDGAPISKLAFEGNIHAVEYLQKEFNASSRWVIYGYGRSVNIIEAQRLLSRAKSYNEYLQLLRQYVKGLAVRNNEDAQKELKSIFEKLSEYEKLDLNAPMVCGYILGGHEAPDIRYNDGVFWGLEPTEIIHAKISAWARTNRLGEAKKYMREKQRDNHINARDAHLDFRNQPKSTFNYDDCVKHYYYSLARIGLLDEAMDLIYSFGEPQSYYIWGYQTAIVLGLGRGGYHKKALDLIVSCKFFQRYLYKSRPGDVVEVGITQHNRRMEEQKQLFIQLILGLAKNGALELINSLTANTCHGTYSKLKVSLLESFLKKAYLHEARQLIAEQPRGNTWFNLMSEIIKEMDSNVKTDLFQRTALDFVTDWMVCNEAILEDHFYPKKFAALKPKAMALSKIIHHRTLSFAQSLAWYDAVALQILLQLSKDKRISLEPLLIIFNFLFPMTRTERQEVMAKYYFQVRTKKCVAEFSSDAEFKPLIASWQKFPRNYRNGVTLFRMVKEKKLLTKAEISLKLEKEEKPNRRLG